MKNVGLLFSLIADEAFALYYHWVSFSSSVIAIPLLLQLVPSRDEAAAVECKSPFDCNTNHLTLGKASVLIARNIGQALQEMIHI